MITRLVSLIAIALTFGMLGGGASFHDCGRLEPGPQGGCPLLVTDDGVFYLIENTGKFDFGDRVYVAGDFVAESLLCIPGPSFQGIENNTIEDASSDLDCDFAVGVTDLLIVLGDWGCTGDCAGDANQDDATTVLDLLQVLSNWG